MAENSLIEWTHHTHNPWWGCADVSEACRHCYAKSLAKRFGRAEWGPKTDRWRPSEQQQRKPLAWDRAAAATGSRHRVFCASMADVFEVRDDLQPDRERLWTLISNTPNLDWLLLTKRPGNIAPTVPWVESWPSNVWLGTTVEDQRRAEERIPELIRNHAAVRFLSVEPMLGPVDLTPWIKSIDWVICGGESGPGSRPMQVEWARALRDQCVAAGVPFFFKQWGQWSPNHSGNLVRLRSKKDAGRTLDGRTWDEFPLPRAS